MSTCGSPPVRIGMAQMLVEFGQPRDNLDRACDMIAQAAAGGCNIVVLPEVLDLGWPYNPETGLAEAIPGPRTRRLAQAAEDHKIYVLAGLTERANGNFHNAAVFLSPTGELLHVHRKINTLTHVEGVYTIGDRLGIVPTPFGNVGIDICADSFMQAVPHMLCRMGASMILSPCAWAVRPDHDNATDPYGKNWLDTYGTISRLYNVAFIGVSNVGQVTYGAWSGWRCIGCSLAIGPDGEVLAKGAYGADAQALLTVEFVPRPPAARGGEWSKFLHERGYTGA